MSKLIAVTITIKVTISTRLKSFINEPLTTFYFPLPVKSEPLLNVLEISVNEPFADFNR